MDPIIYREPLQTEQYDSMSLNGESQFSQVQYILCYAHEVFLLYRSKTAEMTATWRRTSLSRTVVESVIDYGSWINADGQILLTKGNRFRCLFQFDLYVCTVWFTWPNQLSAFFISSEWRTTRKSWSLAKLHSKLKALRRIQCSNLNLIKRFNLIERVSRN